MEKSGHDAYEFIDGFFGVEDFLGFAADFDVGFEDFDAGFGVASGTWRWVEVFEARAHSNEHGSAGAGKVAASDAVKGLLIIGIRTSEIIVEMVMVFEVAIWVKLSQYIHIVNNKSKHT